MKVTKQGVNPATIVHKATCHNCKTEFEFLESDSEITIKPSSDPRDCGLREAHFNCSTCGKPVVGFMQR